MVIGGGGLAAAGKVHGAGVMFVSSLSEAGRCFGVIEAHPHEGFCLCHSAPKALRVAAPAIGRDPLFRAGAALSALDRVIERSFT